MCDFRGRGEEHVCGDLRVGSDVYIFSSAHTSPSPWRELSTGVSFFLRVKEEFQACRGTFQGLRRLEIESVRVQSKKIGLDLGVGAEGHLGTPTQGLLKAIKQSFLKNAGSDGLSGPLVAGYVGHCL